MFVLFDGNSFVSTYGPTSNINDAILFQNIDYVENNEDYKFSKVQIDIVNKVLPFARDGYDKHFVGMSAKGHFLITSGENFQWANEIDECSLFAYSNDTLVKEPLRKKLSQISGIEIYLIEVWAKADRRINLCKDSPDIGNAPKWHAKQSRDQFCARPSHPTDPVNANDNDLPF